jgi:hypothetical protein
VPRPGAVRWFTIPADVRRTTGYERALRVAFAGRSLTFITWPPRRPRAASPKTPARAPRWRAQASRGRRLAINSSSAAPAETRLRRTDRRAGVRLIPGTESSGAVPRPRRGIERARVRQRDAMI